MYPMPRKKSRNAQLEKLLQQKQQSDYQVALLQQQLQQSNGFFSPPLPRPTTQQWDWNCGGCGRLVYTPQTRCNCNEANNTRRFGATAVELVLNGVFGVMVANRPPSIVPVPLSEVVGRTRTVPLDSDLIKSAGSIGVVFGD